MMLYTFVKDASGNVERVGAECSVPQELQDVLLNYSKNGCLPADAAEYDEQVIGGAQKGSLPYSVLIDDVAYVPLEDGTSFLSDETSTAE